MKLELWQTVVSLLLLIFRRKNAAVKIAASSVSRLSSDYDSLARLLAAKSKSKAANVSWLFRCFRSETQSVTVETISLAATLGLAVFPFLTAIAVAASVFFTILILALFIITILPPLEICH